MSNVQFVSEQFSAYEAYPICKRIAVLLEDQKSAVKFDKDKLKEEVNELKIINDLLTKTAQENACFLFMVQITMDAITIRCFSKEIFRISC